MRPPARPPGLNSALRCGAAERPGANDVNRMQKSALESIVTRGGAVESIHQTAVVLISPDDQVAFSAGPVGTPWVARSALKPFQAVALVASGALQKFTLGDAALALACASHSGQVEHLVALRRFQAQVGVAESDLQCGSHWPYHEPSRDALLAAGETASALTNNCSGKHTGFLAAALALEAGLDSYLDPGHPVQQLITGQLEDWLGRRDISSAVDGCSAPTHQLTLTELAGLARRLIEGQDALLAPQLAAMQAEPFLIAGSGRFDTAFMVQLGDRAVSKEGAEGIQLIGLRDVSGEAWGLALKVLDGSNRPKPQVALTVLAAHELLHPADLEALDSYYRPTYKNRQELEVGRLQTVIPEG